MTCGGGQNISIHALLAESDPGEHHANSQQEKFLSTLSLRRATNIPSKIIKKEQNFYPRSPCGERRPLSINCMILTHFYPRSPCGERRTRIFLHRATNYISIHALLAESDRAPPYNLMIHHTFLSTLSLRRATGIIDIINNIINDFYPRSPCGERQGLTQTDLANRAISIHALLAESDMASLT